jgi:plastocyanin
MRKFSVLAIVVLALAAVLAACGGGAASGGAATSIKTTMTDFKYDPAEWTVPAGKSITIELTNKGSVDHDWVLMATPVTPPLASEKAGTQLAAFKVAAGQTQSFTFTAPATAGDYQVVCTVPGHLDAGMSGKLHVTQ